jgi:hypothetical protein
MESLECANALGEQVYWILYDCRGSCITNVRKADYNTRWRRTIACEWPTIRSRGRI